MESLEEQVLRPLGVLIIEHLLEPLDRGVKFVAPAYHAFLRRPRPNTATVGGASMGDWFYVYTCGWAVFFTVCFLVIPVVSRRFFPVWWDSLKTTVKGRNGKDKVIDYRRDFPSYVVCMMHHVVVVPRSWYRIYQDYNLPRSQWATFDYGPVDYIVAPFLLGYLLSDSICYALPNLSVEYILHHTFTIAVTAAGHSSDSYLSRFIPHLLSSDTTQLFFNGAWLLKRFGWKDDSPLCMLLEILFVFAFPCVRIIILPMAFLTVTLNGSAIGFGWVRYMFLPLSLMQYYWFSKIISRLWKIVSPSPAKPKPHTE